MSELSQTEDSNDGHSSKQFSISEWVIVVLAIFLVLIVAVTVFCRYLLNIGIDWSDEVSRLIFIWMVFLGIYIAFKRKNHPVVSILSSLLPVGLKRYHTLLVGLMEAVFMFIVAWFGIVQVMDTAKFGQVTPGLGVPMFWLYLVIPVTAVLITFSVLRDTFRNFNRKGGHPDWVE